MKSPLGLLFTSLVLGAATLPQLGANSLVSASTALYDGADYHRYLVEKDEIGDELKAWMTKWSATAQKHGWLPQPKSKSATDQEIDEDRRQRFFLAKQLVVRLKEQNPCAEFSTDSPFTLLTTDEFAAYVKSSYVSGTSSGSSSSGATPLLRSEPDPVELARVTSNHIPSVHMAKKAPSPTPTPTVTQGVVVDWAAGNCMAPVQNQGQCGSCWAFASVAAVETAQCLAQSIATGNTTLTKLSEQTLASCDTRNSGCNGGVPLYAMQFIQQNGLCTLADDPYTAGAGVLAACNTGCTKLKSAMKGVQSLAQTEPALLSALAIRPVVIAVQAGNDAWKQYKSGVLSACPNATASIDHAVVAVGYNDVAIKIRNSWGASWGEAGYIRLARSTAGLGTCKMLQQMTASTF